MSKPNKVVKEIENYLKDDQEKLDEFQSIMSNIDENMEDPDQIFDQIIELIQDNKELLNSFTQGMESIDGDLGAFSEFETFIETVNSNVNNKNNSELFAEFSHVISLFTNELITFQFFEERILKLTISLSSSSRQAIKKDLKTLEKKILTSDEQDFFKTLRKDYLNELHDDFVIKSKYTPSILVRLLVMTGCICNMEQMNTILSALKLYSSNLIHINNVFYWINSIDQTIAQTFEEAAQTESIESFYPRTIFESMKTELNENQLKWCLSDTLYSILNESEKPNEKPLSFLNLAIEFEKKNSRDKDRNEVAAFPYIAELQCVKLFKIIRIMSDFYCSENFNSQPKIPTYLTDLIFGKEKFDPNTCFPVLMEKCISVGSDVNVIERYFLEMKLRSYPPSSSNWRTAFHAKFQKRYIVHTLFFTGNEIEFKNGPDEKIMKLSSEIVKDFSTKFSKIDSHAVDSFLKMFDGGEFDLTEEAAIATAGFMEVISMVSEAVHSKSGDDEMIELIQKIPDIVWEQPSPLIDFDGLAISNIDLALKYIIRNVHKAYQKFPQQFQLKKYSFPPVGIAYHFSVGENKYGIKGYINPAFD